jgi:hypothetical protein
MKTTHLLGCVALSAAVLTLPVAGAAEPVFYHDVDLRLTGALPGGDNPKDLVLYLGYRDGQWDKHAEGWAYIYWMRPGVLAPKDRYFNAMDHHGVVQQARAADGRITLTVAMTIRDDPWVAGGPATYTLDLKQDGLNFSGTFTGQFKEQHVQGDVAGRMRETLWPSPVAGVQRFAPGEHPRILFRKSDLPALRARMETPEGKEILARLREQLGGGEAMPTQFQTATAAYGKSVRLPLGAYTLQHAMGFGLLYQLTGEQKYADLARQCVDKAVVEKVRDRDPRYSWDRPGGKLRAGSSYAAIATAYDLCYDAWPEEYRRGLAGKIQDKIIRAHKPDTVEMGQVVGEDPNEKAMAEPVNGDLVFNTLGGQHSPLSNHYGAWNGGGGTALLAILNDPGTDNELCELAHRIFQRRAKRALEVGYGSAAFFFEGHHCGRLSTNTGLSSYLQALRIAEGKDFIENSPEATWLLTKWIYEIVRYDSRLVNLQRGMYAAPTFERDGLSSGGDFSQGFGILPEAHKPAVLWFYNHVISPGPKKDYDALMWPHRAVYAFVNWPIGLREKHPAELLPKYLRDYKAGYYVFRSGWNQTGDDVVATMYVHSMLPHTMASGVRIPGAIFGHGVNGSFTPLRHHDTVFTDIENGAACILQSGTQMFVADMSGLSGAPLVLIQVTGLPDVSAPPKLDAADPLAILTGRFEPRRERVTPPPKSELTVGIPDVPPDKVHQLDRTYHFAGCKFVVTTFQKGNAPKGKLAGDGDAQHLVLGNRTLAVVNDKLLLGRAD